MASMARRPVQGSRGVVGLGRRVTRLRLREQSLEVRVGHLDQRALPRARAHGRVPCHAHLAIRSAPATSHENQCKLVAVILRDASGREHAPGSAIGGDGTVRHLFVELHFHGDAARIDDGTGCRLVSPRERLTIRRFDEFEKGARKFRLFECPESAIGFCVVIALAAKLSLKAFALGRCDERPMNRKSPSHDQSTFSGNVSIACLTKDMNRSASAPSTIRWSNDNEKYAHVLMAMTSSPSTPVITFGRFSIAPTQRMATCG